MTTAYRLTSPVTRATYGDGLNAAYDHGPASVPPTWFIDGVAYVPADHPRAGNYLAGPFRAEPVDAIPRDYVDQAAALTARPIHHLGPPTPDAAA